MHRSSVHRYGPGSLHPPVHAAEAEELFLRLQVLVGPLLWNRAEISRHALRTGSDVPRLGEKGRGYVENGHDAVVFVGGPHETPRETVRRLGVDASGTGRVVLQSDQPVAEPGAATAYLERLDQSSLEPGPTGGGVARWRQPQPRTAASRAPERGLEAAADRGGGCRRESYARNTTGSTDPTRSG